MRYDNDLNSAGRVQLPHNSLLFLGQTLVQEPNSLAQRVLQSRARALLHKRCDRGLIGLHKTVSIVSSSVSQQVERNHATLLLPGNKDDHRVLGRVGIDGQVCGTAHCQHPRRERLHVESLYVYFERHWAHVGVEVKQAMRRASNPLAQVPGVRK